MALILNGEDYARWVEGHHPHVPLVPKAAEIEKLLASMTAEDRRATVDRAKQIVAYGKAVQEVATRMR